MNETNGFWNLHGLKEINKRELDFFLIKEILFNKKYIKFYYDDNNNNALSKRR